MELNNLDGAEDIERRLRELAERMATGERIEAELRGRRVTVERLNDDSFRVRSDVMDVRREDIIVLPSREEREVRWAIPKRNRRWGKPFYIYFATTER